MREPSSIFFSLCGAQVRVDFAGHRERCAIEGYLRPALSDAANAAPVCHLGMRDTGVEVLAGPKLGTPPPMPPLLELEWALSQLCLILQPGVPLHAGCFVYKRRPMLLVAPSGGGKSSMTLAALRAGASYVTDDLLILKKGTGHGLARAIRFKLEPLRLARKRSYLSGMDLDSQILPTELGDYTAPTYPGPYSTLKRIEFAKYPPPVVVRVSRGSSNTISRLNSLQRALILHEAAIAKYAEYDGSLGPGPTFDLVWNDPEKSFGLLAEQLEGLD